MRFKPLIASFVLFFTVYLIAGKAFSEWQTSSVINADPVATEAAVIGRTAIMAGNSGKITKYDVTYEFVAPKASGGSDYSRAALSKKLADDFYKRSGDNQSSNQSELQAARTDGNQYFSRTQAIEPEMVNSRLNGSTIQIVYARNNPQNSMIAGTGDFPILFAVLLAALLMLGGYLFYLGVSPIFRRRSAT